MYTNSRYDYIDALRGLAILAVVGVHASQIVPGLPAWLDNLGEYGSRGVQLFFIVSALTLLMATRVLEVKSFYLRRFFRIAPMFYLAIPLYWLGATFYDISYFPDKGAGWADIVTTLGFVHGWSLTALNSVVPGGWSIACEVMFYLLFPVLFVFIRKPWQALVAWGLSFVVAVAALVGLPILLHGMGPEKLVDDFAHFYFLAHLPAFLGGFVVYHFMLALRNSPRLARNEKLWNAATVGMALMLLVSAVSGMKILTHTLPATMMLVGFVIAVGFSQPRVLVNPLMKHMGMVSFSMYILHFGVLSILRTELVPSMLAHGLAPVAQLAVLFGGTLLVSLMLATGTYGLIEKPMIQLGRKLSPRPEKGIYVNLPGEPAWVPEVPQPLIPVPAGKHAPARRAVATR